MNWTKEKCQDEALKYENRTDFRLKSQVSYNKARKNDWLDDVCSHMKVVGNLHKRCIYVFEFSDNYAYVGLTFNYEKRIEEHIIDDGSAVYQKMLMSGLSYITKKLTDYVDVNDAKLLEGEYVRKYKLDNWFILNRNRTGSIGGCIKKGEVRTICESCKIEKDNKDFYSGKNTCKSCISKQRKEYYQENKEVILERNKEYKENNKEKIKIKEKEYYENHKEYYKKYSKKYRLENKVYFLEYSKMYREKNQNYFKNYYLVNSEKFSLLDLFIELSK